jgi:putative phage-type endonuclease
MVENEFIIETLGLDANKVKCYNYKDEEEWLSIRRMGITGTDVSVIIGSNPYTTQAELAENKLFGTRKEQNEAMFWGNKLEDVVSQVYSERLGVEVRQLAGVLSSVCLPTVSCNVPLLGTPDRFILDKDGKAVGILEIKTGNIYTEKNWDGDHIPDHYYDQVQWYMGVSGIYSAEFAVLLGGSKFFTRHVDFSAEQFEKLKNNAVWWWKKYIIDREELSHKNIRPESDKEFVFREEIAPIVNAYKDALEEEKKAKAIVEEAKSELLNALGAYRNVCSGMYNVRRIYVDGVTRLDTTRLKEEHPDIYDQYKVKGNGFDKLEVKLAF